MENVYRFHSSLAPEEKIHPQGSCYKINISSGIIKQQTLNKILFMKQTISLESQQQYFLSDISFPSGGNTTVD